jgi:hypothetical protein
MITVTVQYSPGLLSILMIVTVLTKLGADDGYSTTDLLQAHGVRPVGLHGEVGVRVGLVVRVVAPAQQIPVLVTPNSFFLSLLKRFN